MPELGDRELQDRAAGKRERLPSDHVIEDEEQSAGGERHFCSAKTALGLTGSPTLTKCGFQRFRELKTFEIWRLRPRRNPQNQTREIPRENASENGPENLA